MSVSPEPAGRHAYTLEQGTAAVRAARERIEAAVRKERYRAPDMGPPFDRLAGVFTTISEHPSGKLRGCIGFAVPVMLLQDGITVSAKAAALEDPRFSPVDAAELPSLVVEVSLLTPLHEVSASPRERLPDEVVVGKHGLVARGRGRSGLLLPQVAVEWKWGAEEFLEHTCQKAGLPPRAWRDPDIRLFAFEAEVFAEESPGGAVVRHEG